jgi:hypothetical protein
MEASFVTVIPSGGISVLATSLAEIEIPPEGISTARRDPHLVRGRALHG